MCVSVVTSSRVNKTKTGELNRAILLFSIRFDAWIWVILVLGTNTYVRAAASALANGNRIRDNAIITISVRATEYILWSKSTEHRPLASANPKWIVKQNISPAFPVAILCFSFWFEESWETKKNKNLLVGRATGGDLSHLTNLSNPVCSCFVRKSKRETQHGKVSTISSSVDDFYWTATATHIAQLWTFNYRMEQDKKRTYSLLAWHAEFNLCLHCQRMWRRDTAIRRRKPWI